MDIHAWLKEEKISAEVYDAEMLLAGFLDEMEKGLNGADSSLAMLPSYIGISGELPASANAAPMSMLPVSSNCSISASNCCS